MSIRLYELLLGCWHCGATAVFLDAWAGRKRLEQAARLAQCRGFVGTAATHLLKAFSRSLRSIPVSVWAGWKHRTDGAVCGFPSAFTTANHPALITFTTGTTGIPKAANRTHGFLRAQHEVLREHLRPGPDDVDLVTLPIFMLTNLASGITSVIPDFDPAHPERIDPGRILSEIENCMVTSSCGSPALFERLADYCIRSGLRASCLKKISVGGAPVWPSLAAKLRRAFPDASVSIVYGSTESEPISVMGAEELACMPDCNTDEGLCVGKPVAACSVRIIRFVDGPIAADSKDAFDRLCVAAGTVGEICVSGRHVLTGYLGNFQAQALNKIDVEGTIWHRTGDAGYIDGQGCLFLMGRTSNRFILDGKVRFLFPLEHRLLCLEKVAMATVIAAGEKVTVCVEASAGTKGPEEAAVRKCLQSLGFSGDMCIVRCRIPRDPRHHSKIDYDRLRVSVAGWPGHAA